MKTLKGIDVSVHQGTVDWGKVKAAGIKCAILKAGYGWGNGVGKKFSENIAGCKSVGFPYGIYWYGYAGTPEQAKAEAESCIAAIRETGAVPTFGIWYDLEENSHANMTAAALWKIFVTFRDALAAAGYEAGIYSFKAIMQRLYDAMPEELEASKVWLAQLDKNTYGGHVDIWQYSHTGTVSGIGTAVDLNELYQEEDDTDEETQKAGTDRITELEKQNAELAEENAALKEKIRRVREIAS